MDLELTDRAACYRIFQSHDARFDGRLFVGVTSTGIYCRPVCPARPPKFENCRFFASAAAAQEAGFRPCLRCRPEIAPELAFWRGSSNTVNRALKLIAEGALDESDASLDRIAAHLSRRILSEIATDAEIASIRADMRGCLEAGACPDVETAARWECAEIVDSTLFATF